MLGKTIVVPGLRKYCFNLTERGGWWEDDRERRVFCPETLVIPSIPHIAKMVATPSLAALALFLVLPRLVNPLDSSIGHPNSTVAAQETRNPETVSLPLYGEISQVSLRPKPRVRDDKYGRLQCSKLPLGSREHTARATRKIQSSPTKRSGLQVVPRKRSNGGCRSQDQSQPSPTKPRSTRAIVGKWATVYAIVLLGVYVFILPVCSLARSYER